MTNNPIDGDGPQPLAEVRPKTDRVNIGATINVSPNAYVNYSLYNKDRKANFVKWDTLNAKEQSYILEYYIRSVYLPSSDEITVGFEFTKALMVHAHLHLYIDEPDNLTNYYVRMIRVDVERRHKTSKVFKCGKYDMRLNYIHDLEKKGLEQWIAYIQKDKGCMPVSVKTILNAHPSK